MKSLRVRLDPIKEEVVAYTKKFGRTAAMHNFGVRDYKCFSEWLTEVTGDANFGLNPQISLNSRQSLGDQLVAAFLRKVADLETENERLREENRFLKWQLDPGREKEMGQAVTILEACES